MKKHLPYIVVLILIGFLINVIIAIMAPFLSGLSRSGPEIPRVKFNSGQAAIADALELSDKASVSQSGRWNLIGKSYYRDWVIWSNDNGTHEAGIVVHIRYEPGFPFRSFESSQSFGVAAASRTARDAQRVMTMNAVYLPRPRHGLIWNSILYAAILWFILYLARRVDYAIFRRRYRQLRGHCLTCGYDLRHAYNIGCPECGWNRDTQN